MTANSTSPKTQMKQAKNDTGLLVPLLSEVESSENQITNGASISGAVLNISTTMIGAGIMSLPATIKVLGIIPVHSSPCSCIFCGDNCGVYAKVHTIRPGQYLCWTCGGILWYFRIYWSANLCHHHQSWLSYHLFDYNW